jgi:hypothetical protein
MHRLQRWLTVVGAASAGFIVALHLVVQGFDRLDVALSAATPEPVLVAVAQIVAAISGCWLMLGALCVLLGQASCAGDGTARRGVGIGVPRFWRVAVLAAVGTGLLTGPGVATAAVPSQPHPDSPPFGTLSVLDGLRLPDRASGAWHRTSPAVVVSRGDCLWSLVASRLPATATESSIVRHTRRWYVTNADVIGADPDLLLPGTRLHAPGSPIGTTGTTGS